MQIKTVKLESLESLKVGDEVIVVSFEERRISFANDGTYKHHIGKIISVNQERKVGLNGDVYMQYRVMGGSGLFELSGDTNLSKNFQVWKLELDY